MAYPLRGAWVFYNVRRAASFWPTLESIEITQEYPDVVASMSCTVVDADGTLEFDVEDEVRATFAGDRIFAGHLKVVTKDRLEETGPRIWRLEAQGYTAKLGDAIIRQQKQRKKESALRRIRWILSYLDNAWNLDGRELDVPDEDVERQDMFGMSVAEALDSVANEVGLRYWVDLDNVLHVEKATTTAAPFGLSNVAPDLTTTFPFREFAYRRDTSELANAVLVEPEKREDSKWAVAPANIALYEWGDSTGRQELFIAAEEIRTARAAERHADAQVQRTKQAEGEATLVCFQPGIWAGMTVNVEEALWDIDAPFKVVRVDISAVDPHDADGTAYMRCELTLNNKRKRRKPKMGRGDIEAGGTADTRPKPVDRFSRVVAQATIETGDALGVSLVGVGATKGVNVNGVEQPFVLGTNFTSRVGSYVGDWYKTRSAPDYACDYPDGDFRGWWDKESWAYLTVSAHPAGMAGVYVTIHPFGADGSGYGAGGRATIDGLEVVAKSSAPTDTWQGSPIGKVVAFDADTVVLIPAAYVPLEGGSLWVGVRANWRCDYAANPPYCDYPLWPYDTGLGNSGRCQVSISDPTWATTSGAAVVWGTTEDGHDWQDAGTEGAPVAGMDGSAFYVEGPGGQALAVEGGEEAEMDGTWSSVSWAVKVRFTADALAAGGSITLTTTGQGHKTVGIIDLGTVPAITVGGPTTTDSAAAAIGAGETWIAKFDSRSGAFRGKVWRVYAPEPALWDVEVPMSETEDDADRFEMWVRAGTEQTIRVLDIESFAAARPGEEVVTELLGHADGATNRFVTNHRYRGGTLIPWVLGVADPATQEDGATTEFVLDFYPTTGSPIHASYIAAGQDTPTPAAFSLVTGPSFEAPDDTSVVIEWEMSEVCTGQVEYGATSAYGLTTAEQPITGGYSLHQQTITGLTEGTTYHFRTKSTSAAGVTVYSDDQTFTTTEVPSGEGMTYDDYTFTGTTIAALQTFIASVPDGSSETVHSRVLLSGTITGATGLSVVGRSHITFDGQGTEAAYGHTGGAVLKTTGSPSTWMTSSCIQGATQTALPSATDLRFCRMTFEGSSTNYASAAAGDGGEGQHGIYAAGVDGLEVRHCIFDKLKGDGVYLTDSRTSNANTGYPCHDVWIHDSTVKNNGRMGIALIWAVDVTIEDNQFTDICYAPVDVEPNKDWQGISGTTIVQDNVVTGRWSWGSSYNDPFFFIGNKGIIAGTIYVLRNTMPSPQPYTTKSTFHMTYEATAMTKTAIFYIEDNVMTGGGRPAPAMRIKNFVNGGYVRRNVGFISSETPWLADGGGNGTIVQSGNT